MESGGGMTVKKVLTTAMLVALLPMTAQAQQPDQTPDRLVAEARSKVQAFGGSLKQALQAAIKEGGLTNGIAVCNTVAPEIAAANSNDEWQISRTSLRVRNPGNSATDWQEMQLKAMQEHPVKDGKPVEIWRVADADTGKGFEYMRAIPTQKLCLGCHGKSIDPAVQAGLNELYPQDKATGFSEGDLRGAFVVTYQPKSN